MTDSHGDILKHLSPFGDFSIGDRLQFAQRCEYQDLMTGDKVFFRDAGNYLLYLVEGKIDLYEQYQQGERVIHTDPRAQHPLFSAKESLDTYFIVQSKCRLMRIDRELFNSVLEKEVMVEESASSANINIVEVTIYNKIMQAIDNESLHLPSLPEIALRVKKALEKPNVDVNDVAHIVEFDPAMAARLIQVANSPLTRGVEPVSSIRDVIVRLGLTMTQNLVLSLAIKQLFKSQQKLLKQKMQKLYKHSIEIAAISFALASKLDQFDADKLLLAGLVHDIGVIPLLTYIEETGLEIVDEAEVDKIINSLRPAVGAMVIKSWDFPVEMIAVVTHAENWSRDSGKQLDMADIIILAQIYSLLQHKQTQQLPEVKNIPAFRKLFPGKHDPAFTSEVLEQAKEEIAEVKRLLEL